VLLRSQLEGAEKRIREMSGDSEPVVMEESSHESLSNLLCLKRIDFKCKPGELVAVVGGVGCGK
jgi:ABC-type glutathione transport system ATPase component